MDALAERGFFSRATLEITTRCNLSCRYCYIDSHGGELSTGQWRSTIDRLADAGVIAISLTGGEPFCRSDIMDILDHIFRRGFFQVSLLTNGTLLTPEHIDCFSRNADRLGYVRISFFSHIASVHDAFTGVPGSFDRSLSNASALSDAGVKVGAMINATTENLDRFQDTKAFFLEKGFLVYDGVVKFMSDENVRSVCGPAIEKAFFKKYFSHFSPSMLEMVGADFRKRCTNGGDDDYLCEAVLGTIAILADGAIVPCISFRQQSIGNVLEYHGDLQTLYSESPLVMKLHSLRRRDVVPCNTCKYKRFCTLCPGMMLQEHGVFVKPNEQNCNYAKALEEATGT